MAATVGKWGPVQLVLSCGTFYVHFVASSTWVLSGFGHILFERGKFK